MERLTILLNNPYIQIPIIAWFTAQLIKVLTVLVQNKKIDFRKFISSGGMPSSHSAFVSSMATTVGEVEGYGSIMFALAFVMALIVMYDASGVRRAAGKQARILNKIIEEMENNNLKMEDRLKELLGHTPVEVFLGALLGIVIAILKV